MKIGALIPIRLRSERLPNKALLEICGRPVCYHLFDRVCASKFIEKPSDVIVCTTTEESDAPLIQAVEEYGCSVFRGDQFDIVSRFAAAMELHGLDYVIQADGDDPLSATEYMDITMDYLLSHPKIDIVTVAKLPIGCATKSFSKLAMNKVLDSYLSRENDTGFIYYFTKTGICEHHEIECTNPNHQHAAARLTLDYPADLQLFRAILGKKNNSDKIVSHEEIIEIVKANKELLKINSNVTEEYWMRTAEKARLDFKTSSGVIKTVEL